jgi:hypothetical protein
MIRRVIQILRKSREAIKESTRVSEGIDKFFEELNGHCKWWIDDGHGDEIHKEKGEKEGCNHTGVT